MNLRQARWAKIALFTLTALAVWALSSRLYWDYQRRLALAAQLEKVQEVERTWEQQQQAQIDQYTQTLAEWEQQQKAVAKANEDRLQAWRRDTVIRQRVRVPEPSAVIAPVPTPPAAGPAITHSELNTDSTVIAAAPIPPAEPQYIVVEKPRPPPQLEPMPAPPEPPRTTRISISTESIEVELNEDTSWQTILQLLVLILGLYAGIRVVNRYTHIEDVEPA